MTADGDGGADELPVLLPDRRRRHCATPMSATVRDLVAPLGDQFELPYVTYCFRAYKL